MLSLPSRALCAFFGVACIDLSQSFILLLSLSKWKLHAIDWSLRSPFESNTADLFWASLIRAFTTFFLGRFAIWMGQPPSISEKERSNKRSDKMSMPLLVDAQEASALEQEQREKEQLKLPRLDDQGASDPDAQLKEQVARDRSRANVRRNACLLLLFLLGTAAQVLVGAKAVSFHYAHAKKLEALQAVSFAILIICCNIEVACIHAWCHRATQPAGRLFAHLHAHPLVFLHNVAAAGGLARRGQGGWQVRCSLCSVSLRGAIGCVKCQYFVCDNCQKKHEEELVAGNKEPGARDGSGGQDGGGRRHGGKGGRRRKNGTSVGGAPPPSVSDYAAKMASLVLPHWRYLLAASLCLLVSVGATLFLPNCQGGIIDAVVRLDEHLFTTRIHTYILLSLLTGLFSGLRKLFFQVVGRQISWTVRNKLFKDILSQPIEFFDSASTGDLISRLSGDAQVMVTPIQRSLSSLLQSSLLICGCAGMCFYISWRLSMLAFTTVAPAMYILEVYARWSSTLNRQIRTELGAANGVATEALVNVRTVKSFSTEWKEETNYRKFTTKALMKGINDAIADAGTTTLRTYLDLGGSVVLLWYGSLMVLRGDGVTVGNLITFQLYWNKINTNFSQLNQVLAGFTRAAGAAQRVLSLMDSLPHIDPDAGEALGDFHGDVALADVAFTYATRPDAPVLRNMRLHVPPGRVLALVGKSGGGKSTVMHLLMRFYDPIAGEVLLDGRPLRSLRLREVHQQMAVVAQDTQLFADTIGQNIAYGMIAGDPLNRDSTSPGLGENVACRASCCLGAHRGRDHILEIHGAEAHDGAFAARLVDASQRANAHGFIMKFSDGYQTRVGERGVRLSGGQRQRVAIARALLRRPKLLLLDEATSALDAESEVLVQDALDRLINTSRTTLPPGGANRSEATAASWGGCTIVLVAHRLSTVVNADQIAVLEEGRVVEQGSHDELMRQQGAYAKLISRQAFSSVDTQSTGQDPQAQAQAQVQVV